MSLWRTTRIVAPDERSPVTIDEWFSPSDSSRHRLPASAGMISEFVAKPIGITIASSLPINSATVCSSSRCSAGTPISHAFVPTMTPLARIVSTTGCVVHSFGPPKPR